MMPLLVGRHLLVILKVDGLESVHSDDTILTPGGITLAVGEEGQRVDGTKVTLDAANLLFQHHVEDASIKLARTAVRRCHLRRLLTTTEDHVVQQGRDARRIHRSLRLIRLDNLNCLTINQLHQNQSMRRVRV